MNKLNQQSLYGNTGIKIISLSNNLLASGSSDGTVKIWNITAAGTLKYSFSGIYVETAIALLGHGGNLVATSWYNTVNVWNIAENTLLYTLYHDNTVFTLASLDNDLLATGSQDNSVKVWNVSDGSLKFSFNAANGGHNGSVTCLANLGNNLLASGSLDKTIRIWDVSTGLLKSTFTSSADISISTLTLLYNRTLLVSAAVDSTLNFWNMSTMSLEYSLPGGYTNGAYGGYANIHSSLITVPVIWLGNNLIASVYAYTIKVWDLSTDMSRQSPKFTLIGHRNYVTSLALADNNSRFLVSGSDDSMVKVWDLATGTLVFSLSSTKGGHIKGVKQVISLGGDGLFATTGSNDDDTIIVWNLKGKSLPNVLGFKMYLNFEFGYGVDILQKFHLSSSTFDIRFVFH